MSKTEKTEANERAISSAVCIKCNSMVDLKNCAMVISPPSDLDAVFRYFVCPKCWRDLVGWIDEPPNERGKSFNELANAIEERIRDDKTPKRAACSANENWLCYECVATIVNSGGRPLIELWGANQTPHKEGQCGKCGKTAVTLVMYPLE